MDSHASEPARLAEDGVTILWHRFGRSADKLCYTTVEELRPGDSGYDELLSTARRNAFADRQSEDTMDAATFAHILRDAGLDASDFEEE